MHTHFMHLGFDPLGRAWQMLAMSSGWKLPEGFWTTYESGSFSVFALQARKGDNTHWTPGFWTGLQSRQTREPSAESTLSHRIRLWLDENKDLHRLAKH